MGHYKLVVIWRKRWELRIEDEKRCQFARPELNNSRILSFLSPLLTTQ